MIKAVPIFLKDKSTEPNVFALFSKRVVLDGGAVKVRVSASSYYRLFINGAFVCHGPARAGHYHARVDEYDAGDFVKNGENLFDLVIDSICGYALAKFEFRGRKLMLSFIVALMVLPMEAILLPLYIEMSQLGWVNTLRALVIPFIAKCFSIYMFYNFFHDIPDDLIEAAAIDGSSPVRTFFSIVMPISKTVYATVFILDFVAHWNDFMWPFLVMTGEDKRTIQLAVQSFFSTSPVHYSAIMAALVVSAIPMIIMFIFMQKYYVEGIASSGIKG